MKKDDTKLIDNAPADGFPSDKPKTRSWMKQKSHSPELISRPLVTTASQENDVAKIQNKIITTKKYLNHDPNDFNLSIMVSKRYRKNTFKADPDVMLEEYVYMGRQLETVESPFSQIAMSLVRFLDTGEYVDTTGVAKVNFSPSSTHSHLL